MNRRPLLLYYTVATVAVGALLLVVGIAIARATTPPPAPPLAYTQNEYQPERSIYAPGETLVYTASLTVKQDGWPNVVRGFRVNPGETRARLCDGTFAKNIVVEPEYQPAPFPPAAVGNEVEGRIEVPIPDLRPGDYWLTSSVFKASGGGEAVTTVRFSVARACPT
jgi:hypothetical protein